MTFNTQYSDTGLFGVYYVAELDNIYECHWAVMREFQVSPSPRSDPPSTSTLVLLLLLADMLRRSVLLRR